MAKRAILSDLRTAIDDMNHKVMKEGGNGEAANATVLGRVRDAHADMVSQLTPQLVDRALTQLLNEVSHRKRKSALMPDGFDLFGEYRSIPKRVSLVRGLKKDVSKLNLQEADLWLKARSEKAHDKRHETFRRLVDHCRPYMTSDEDTLEVAIARKRRAEELSIQHAE